jgi:hypothetical protein
MFLDHATTTVGNVATSPSNTVSAATPGDAGGPRVSAGQLRVRFQKDGSAVVETHHGQPAGGVGVSGSAAAQPTPGPQGHKKTTPAPQPTSASKGNVGMPSPAPPKHKKQAPATATAAAPAATPAPAQAATALAAQIEGLAQELASRLNDVSDVLAWADQASSAAGPSAAQQAPVQQAPVRGNPNVAGSSNTAPAAAAPDPAVLEELKTQVQNHLAEAVSAGTGVDLVKKLVSTVLASAGIASAPNAVASDSAAAKPQPNCP